MKNLYTQTLEETPIGPITLAASDAGVLVIEIGRDISSWERVFSRHGFVPANGTLPFAVAAQLTEYFSGLRRRFDLPIDWTLTTPFQRKTLEAVAGVPYGETSTYSAVAAAIEQPKAVRAVGRANATNPLTIVLPCHRLIGADGALRGYRAPDGVRTKAWLLAFEQKNR